MVEASHHVGQWRNDVMSARAAHRGAPITGPLEIEIVFLFPRPKSHFGTGPQRGQAESQRTSALHHHQLLMATRQSLIRSTEDAISASSGYPVIEDDSRVVTLSVHKRYVTDSEACGAVIRVIESQYDSQRPSTDLRGNAEALVFQ